MGKDMNNAHGAAVGAGMDEMLAVGSKKDQKGEAGAGKPDAGALAAFGGLSGGSKKIEFETDGGSVSIDKPGYPMHPMGAD